VGGRRIIDRLVEVCYEAFGSPPLLVANAPDAASWRPELRLVRDVRPGLGAVGGLLTAVIEAPAPVVVVAWDMPFVTAPLLRALADGLDGADACLPGSDGPRGMEPLCAAYGPACAPAIEAAVAGGDRRAIGFHDRIRVGILSGGTLAAFGDPAVLFFNVNTPADGAEAEALWRIHGSSR
ncbi:MAG: molybdenum cofactor guanylyltransferase, partial [Gemmatimonadota bacterium]|nr:molybdenum cofactor guanylyltransferase [Gemmatimonadota bacterium]